MKFLKNAVPDIPPPRPGGILTMWRESPNPVKFPREVQDCFHCMNQVAAPKDEHGERRFVSHRGEDGQRVCRGSGMPARTDEYIDELEKTWEKAKHEKLFTK